MPSSDRPDGLPSTAEIAALTARLRTLSNAGAAADSAERARFLADKDALIDRITHASSHADPRPPMRGRNNQDAAAAADEALVEVVRARAHDGSYVLVGPSARTWRTDSATGQPAEPVSEAEHRTVRNLLGRYQLTTTEPAWTDGPDGVDVMSTVLPATDELDYWDDNPGCVKSSDVEHAATAERGLTGAEGPLLDTGPALTAEEAAHELAADGRPLAEARALVQGYLDEVSERVGASVHQWGLDEADLTDIRAGLTDGAVARPPSSDEHARRDQLNRWHTNDHAADAVADDALVRGDATEAPL